MINKTFPHGKTMQEGSSKRELIKLIKKTNNQKIKTNN